MRGNDTWNGFMSNCVKSEDEDGNGVSFFRLFELKGISASELQCRFVGQYRIWFSLGITII